MAPDRGLEPRSTRINSPPSSPGRLIWVGGAGRVDSNRLRAILTPSGRATRVQNARAFCETTQPVWAPGLQPGHLASDSRSIDTCLLTADRTRASARSAEVSTSGQARTRAARSEVPQPFLERLCPNVYTIHIVKERPAGHKKTPVGVNRPGSLVGASLEGSLSSLPRNILWKATSSVPHYSWRANPNGQTRYAPV